VGGGEEIIAGFLIWIKFAAAWRLTLRLQSVN
jgi:hypothetical protein